MRKNRIWFWILSLVVAVVLFMGEEWFHKITAEKSPLYVYAPAEMEKAFKRALTCSEIEDLYEIVMTNDITKGNIVVEMGKEFDPEYTKIAYSPFVVAYHNNDKNIKNMVKSGMLQDAFFNSSYKEICFSRVIEEVLGEGSWENLGVKDMGALKVYYPASGTKYYSDYYDFMLVTANGGAYPKSEGELKQAMEQIAAFENSPYTEGVKDFSEKIERTGGFMENTLYLIPEQEAHILIGGIPGYARLFYPTTTVYANYYVKADELGDKLVVVFSNPDGFWGDFYTKIASKAYRSDYKSSISKDITAFLEGKRDVYNVLHLEKDRIRPETLEVKVEAAVVN